MKASNYNYIIYQNNQSYWYNGLEHTYFKLPKDLGLKIERLLTDKERIEFIPKVLKDKLSASGFIVPDNTDELSINSSLKFEIRATQLSAASQRVL